jgi:hypothetical protein
MSFVSLNAEVNNNNNLITNGLSVTLDNDVDKKNDQIVQGMSPEEIADIVSDHLINIVKKQFEIAKERYRQGQLVVLAS